MQGTRPADATGLTVKRRRSTKPDSVTLASVILASAAVTPVADAKAFRDRAGARKILGDVVERLLGILDAIEGDPDLEETGDLEPSLGAYYGGSPDLELDPADNEQSLGSFDRMMDQTKSYRQTVGWNRGDDCEQDDCDREDGSDTELNGDEADDDELELDEGRSGIGDMDGLMEQTGFPVTNWSCPSTKLQFTDQDAEAVRAAACQLREIIGRAKGEREPSNLRAVSL